MKRFIQFILISLALSLFLPFSYFATTQNQLDDPNYYLIKEQAILKEDEHIIGMIHNDKNELLSIVLHQSSTNANLTGETKLFFVKFNEAGEEVLRYEYQESLQFVNQAEIVAVGNNQYLVFLKRDSISIELEDPLDDYIWLIKEDGSIVNKIEDTKTTESLNYSAVSSFNGKYLAAASSQYIKESKTSNTIIRKLDQHAKSIWEITLSNEVDFNQIYAIEIDGDDGFVAIGSKKTSTGDITSWVMKIDKAGNYQLYNIPYKVESASLFIDNQSKAIYAIINELAISYVAKLNLENEIEWSMPNPSSVIFNNILKVNGEQLLVSANHEDKVNQKNAMQLYTINIDDGQLSHEQDLTDYQKALNAPFQIISDQGVLIALRSVLQQDSTAHTIKWSFDLFEQLIPTIAYNATSHTVEVQELVDVPTMFNLTATDPRDGDLTSKIEIDEGNLDVNKAGTYTVVAKVTNSVGNSKSVDLTVIVQSKFKFNIVQIIAGVGGVLFIIAAIALYLYSRKQSKLSKE